MFGNSSGENLCKVCGDRASGRHYGESVVDSRLDDLLIVPMVKVCCPAMGAEDFSSGMAIIAFIHQGQDFLDRSGAIFIMIARLVVRQSGKANNTVSRMGEGALWMFHAEINVRRAASENAFWSP